MIRSESTLETPFYVAGNISALAAMLHFRRTGERYRPRIIAVNGSTTPRRTWRPRPELRVVGHGDSVARMGQ